MKRNVTDWIILWWSAWLNVMNRVDLFYEHFFLCVASFIRFHISFSLVILPSDLLQKCYLWPFISWSSAFTSTHYRCFKKWIHATNHGGNLICVCIIIWGRSVRVQDNMSSIVFMSSVYVQITGNNIYVCI